MATTLAPGIIEDRHGITARIRRGADSALVWYERYPLGTPLEQIEADRLRALADWTDGTLAAPPPAIPNSLLAHDVVRFLAGLPDGQRKKDFAILLAHWIQGDHGRTSRHTLTRDDVKAQLSRWESAGVAIVTRNHRLRALRKLYETLDGDAPNPTDKIKYTTPPATEQRSVPVSVIETILAQLPDRGRAERFGTRPDVSHTKIRLTVMTWTGLPQKQLERLRRSHFDPLLGTLQLPPRKKGKGAPSARVNLLPQAVAALKAFDAADLWGRTFSRSSMRKTWQVGLKRTAKHAAETKDEALCEALRQLPVRCHPYDLRHSFLTEAYRRTGDLRTVKELGQHADLKTTERYTLGAVSERVAAGIAAMAAANPMKTPTPPAPPKPKFRLVARKS